MSAMPHGSHTFDVLLDLEGDGSPLESVSVEAESLEDAIARVRERWRGVSRYSAEVRDHDGAWHPVSLLP